MISIVINKTINLFILLEIYLYVKKLTQIVKKLEAYIMDKQKTTPDSAKPAKADIKKAETQHKNNEKKKK